MFAVIKNCMMFDEFFEVESKYEIKNWLSHLKNYKFGLFLKFGTPRMLTDNVQINYKHYSNF